MEKETVILLHGMLRTHRHMAKLAHALKREGYRVHNLDYPSRRLPMEGLLQGLHAEIAPIVADGGTIHLVGYSMGGLLARAYLHRYRPEGLGKLVQLAPPNQGSEVADAFRPYRWFRWLYGPAGSELGTDQKAIRSLFGPVTYPLGILAGTKCLDPLCARFLPRPHDGKVSVERTKLEGMQAHRTVHATHTFFPTHPEVIAETLYFLRHGDFRPPAKPA